MPINVNLTPELEGLIRQKVTSGRYNSASEVVREALRLMESEDQLRAASWRGCVTTFTRGSRAVRRVRGVYRG